SETAPGEPGGRHILQWPGGPGAKIEPSVVTHGGTSMNVSEIQKALTQAELDAWLLFDFHGINPIASRVAGLGGGHMITRRWFGLLPVQGDPVWLHSAIE